MGRPVILSNSHILVGLDEHGTVHDFYYPYVGLENLASSRNLNHKIGIWADSEFSWLDDGTWDITLNTEKEALISDIRAENKKLAVRVEFQDFVDSQFPVFARLIKITNLSDKERDIRLFTHQAFQISRSGRSDTALFVPNGPYILDYKGWYTLLAYLEDENSRPFDQFAVGNCGIEGKEGTFRDAEDGELSGNLVEHGGVDSVMRLSMKIAAGASAGARYWVSAADSQHGAEKYSRLFKEGGINQRLVSTRQTWKDWLAISADKLDKISSEYKDLAIKSLMIVKSHSDRHGGVIASCDSSIYNYGRDYYNYVWPRDGGYAILPLIELGYKEEPKRFLQFCADTMHP
ncbi:MAG TPA: glycoside hydrolase family 15 protein, partial [Candidatus Saccharimonadales bacterium]|nr:glycoside hydrolase family 15 protein [Candidatus Saccharimonadales bacterium]